MYKEVYEKSLVRRGSRPIFPIEELPEIIESVAASTKVLIGQDSWSNGSRSQLQDYDFWIDIDAANQEDQLTPKSLASWRDYCTEVIGALANVHSIPRDKLKIYFSGRRGFHILLPFGLSQPVHSDQLHKVAKRFCRELASVIKPKTPDGAAIDLTLYGKRHMIRVPWSLHSSGLRKVPLSVGELQLQPEKLLLVIRERSASFKPPLDWSWMTSKQVDTKFTEGLLNRLASKTVSPHTHMGNASNPIIAQYEEDARCMLWFAAFPNLPAQLGFNKPKMFLLSMLKTLGMSHDGALEAATMFAKQFSAKHRSPPNKRQERIMDVESMAKTAYGDKTGQYDYHTPGRCTSLLPTSTGLLNAVATYCISCPRYQPDFRPEENYRLYLKPLLKKKITAEALKIYIELAVNDSAHDLLEIVKRTGLTLYKVRKAVQELENHKLARVTLTGTHKEVSALRPVQKSKRVKI